MASRQNFEKKSDTIRRQFDELRRKTPAAVKRNIDISWSNWGFGQEPLAESVKRLARNDVRFIELHGNRYGADYVRLESAPLAPVGLSASGRAAAATPISSRCQRSSAAAGRSPRCRQLSMKRPPTQAAASTMP